MRGAEVWNLPVVSDLHAEADATQLSMKSAYTVQIQTRMTKSHLRSMVFQRLAEYMPPAPATNSIHTSKQQADNQHPEGLNAKDKSKSSARTARVVEFAQIVRSHLDLVGRDRIVQVLQILCGCETTQEAASMRAIGSGCRALEYLAGKVRLVVDAAEW